MSKRVKVCVVLDTEFVKMLNMSMSLKHPKWLKGDYKGAHGEGQITAVDALAAAVCAEARGALPAQVHGVIPLEWRSGLEILSDEREVMEP